jgi:hypothetical protein
MSTEMPRETLAANLALASAIVLLFTVEDASLKTEGGVAPRCRRPEVLCAGADECVTVSCDMVFRSKLLVSKNYERTLLSTFDGLYEKNEASEVRTGLVETTTTTAWMGNEDVR